MIRQLSYQPQKKRLDPYSSRHVGVWALSERTPPHRTVFCTLKRSEMLETGSDSCYWPVKKNESETRSWWEKSP